MYGTNFWQLLFSLLTFLPTGYHSQQFTETVCWIGASQAALFHHFGHTLQCLADHTRFDPSFSGCSFESYHMHQAGSSVWYHSYCDDVFQRLQAEATYSTFQQSWQFLTPWLISIVRNQAEWPYGELGTLPLSPLCIYSWFSHRL